eukprot:1790942-Prymnesium_polylepis.1
MRSGCERRGIRDAACPGRTSRTQPLAGPRRRRRQPEGMFETARWRGSTRSYQLRCAFSPFGHPPPWWEPIGADGAKATDGKEGDADSGRGRLLRVWGLARAAQLRGVSVARGATTRKPGPPLVPLGNVD